MTDFSDFRDIVVVLGAALLTVLVLGRLQLPKIAGFIVAGAFLGPSGLEAVESVQEIERLAEVGVIFLLFTIGLEFSLTELRRIGRLAALGGSLAGGADFEPPSPRSITRGSELRPSPRWPP